MGNNLGRFVALAGVLIAIGVGWTIWSGRSANEKPKKKSTPGSQVSQIVRPTLTRDGGYLTSNACGECHPKQHASWHQSFHRTMTQVASPGNAATSLDGIELESRSGKMRFDRTTRKSA